MSDEDYKSQYERKTGLEPFAKIAMENIYKILGKRENAEKPKEHDSKQEGEKND